MTERCCGPGFKYRDVARVQIPGRSYVPVFTALATSRYPPRVPVSTA
jgi:hypothetical protein